MKLVGKSSEAVLETRPEKIDFHFLTSNFFESPSQIKYFGKVLIVKVYCFQHQHEIFEYIFKQILFQNRHKVCEFISEQKFG